jgi:hypothetical protein
MHALATPGATTTSASPPRRWFGRATRHIAIVAAVTATLALTAINRPAVALAGVDVAPGVSVDPAPGWTVAEQGPGWVRLVNAFASAEMEIKVKPSRGTDPVAVLQGDIRNLSNVSTTGLTNVRDLGAPGSSPTQGGAFTQQASITYTADGTSRMGPTPVVGSFSELLNPSTHQSAFIVFAQNQDAPPGADSDGQAMIDSLV